MNKRIVELEIIRFICCLLIVLHHADLFSAYSMQGHYAIGFFFALSGFFMQRSAANSCRIATQTIAERSTFYFIFTRVKHVWLSFMVSVAVGLAAWSAMRLVVGPLWWKIAHIWPEMFLLQMFWVWPDYWWITGTAWFLGALFAGQFLMYPLAKFCAKKSIYGLFILSTLISWFLIWNNYPLAFSKPGNIWFGTLHLGLLLGWAGLSYGAALGEIYGRIPYAFLKKIAVWRFLLYFLAIGAMFTNCPGLWIWGLFGLGILLSVAYAAPSAIPPTHHRPWVKFLGEWSIALYLNHYYWGLGLKLKFAFLTPATKWMFYWGLSLLTSLFVWWSVKWALPYLFGKLSHAWHLVRKI